MRRHRAGSADAHTARPSLPSNCAGGIDTQPLIHAGPSQPGAGAEPRLLPGDPACPAAAAATTKAQGRMIDVKPLSGGTRERGAGGRVSEPTTPPTTPGAAPRGRRGSSGTSLPPGPREPFLLGALRVMREGESRFEVLRRRYGDMFTLRVPSLGNVVALTDPELVKQILTADPAVLEAGEGNRPLGIVVGPRSLLLLDGAEHLEQRKLLLPQLHGAGLESYSGPIEELAEEMIDRWPVGRQFPVLPHMQALTLEIIMRVVFGIEEESRLAALRPTLRRLLSLARSREVYVRYLLRGMG
jgi:hypothetical protein